MRPFGPALVIALLTALASGCDERPPATFDAGPRRDAGGGMDAAAGGSDAAVVLPDGAILLPDGALLFPDAGRPPFDGGEEPFDAGTRECPDMDLGSAVGEDVVTSSVDGRGDSFFPTCAEVLGGEDQDYLWTAPSSGEWTFDTHGSEIDTILVLYDGADCAGETELGCNDDLPMVVESSLRLTLSEGDAVLIVVQETRRPQRGTYQLNIHRDVPTSETACGDGDDDDRDGVTDCGDPDCSGVGGCP